MPDSENQELSMRSYLRVDVKFGFGQTGLCANMNALDTWREDEIIVFLGERSKSPSGKFGFMKRDLQQAA